MKTIEMAVIGAGLSGCSLIARLRQCGYKKKIAIIEAGRGPGGRISTRQRHDDPIWRLDHGAPGFTLSADQSDELKELLASLKKSGSLKREQGAVLWLNAKGALKTSKDLGNQEEEWWKGNPNMANICKELIEAGKDNLQEIYGCRIRSIERDNKIWVLKDEANVPITKSKRLVLSGNLLAHPRSLAMLDWADVPLRTAVAKEEDTDLDEALAILAKSSAKIRWNLMVDLGQCPSMRRPLPRQIFLTEDAQEQWMVERIVLQEQTDGRIGVVVHGLDSGQLINPESQPQLMREQERRLIKVLPDLLEAIPGWKRDPTDIRSYGMMRWGASQPLDHPLPSRLQWCKKSKVGFCGDWINTRGFGTAEAAFTSAFNLAHELIKDH